jgi:hypothetical protein
MPVFLIGLDGDCVTYLQRAGHRRTRRSVDDPRPISALQRSLRSGQFDHRPLFGPFPGRGRRTPGHGRRCRACSSY